MDPHIGSQIQGGEASPYLSLSGGPGVLYPSSSSSTPGTTEANGIAFQAYEDNTDTLLSHPLHFEQPATSTYDSTSGSPSLPSPNPDDLPPAPYNAVEQTVIKTGFITKFSEAASSAGLSPEEVTLAVNALIQGTNLTEPLASKVAPLQAKVTAETISEAGLPPTWTFQATTPEAWTPSAVGLLPPGEVMATFTKGLLVNSTQLLEDVEAATQKVVDGLPSKSSANVVFGDFLKLIGEAIADLKSELRKVQQQEAEKDKDLGRAKFSEQADRRKSMIDQEAKQQHLSAKQRKMSKLGDLMKILGPVVAAVSTIVGAALAIFTFGASTALIVAGIAAGTAMTAYSVADSITGCTAKMVLAFTNALKALMPNAPEWEQALVKFAVVMAIVIVVVVIAVVCLASGQEASVANVGAQTASQSAKLIVQETVKQMLIQAATVMLTSSNTLSELTVSIVKAKGGGQEAQMIAQIIAMAVLMVGMTVALAKAMSPAVNAAEQAEEVVEEGGAAAKSVSDQVKKTLKEWGDFIQHELEKPRTTFTDEWNALKKISAGEVLLGICKAAPALANAGPAIANGVMLMQMSRLLRQIGELKAEQEVIVGMIHMLEHLMQNIQTGMSGRNDFITSLQTAYNNIYSSADRSYGNLFSALQQHG